LLRDMVRDCSSCAPIWCASGKAKKAILFITYDIQEPIQLADRVLAISPRSATIQEVVDVDLPRHGDLDSPGCLEKRDCVFRIMGMSLRVGETAAA
jgi:ABC-type nitrate/sulfonate/bicarbonate transport system ATPase subunit